MSNLKGFGGEKTVAVAVDKDKGSHYALKWAIDHALSKAQTVTLIHVSQVPTHLPTSGWNNDASVKHEGDQSQPKDFFLPFRTFCSRRNVQYEVVTLHDNEIAKALIDYVLLHRVDTLVLGAPARNSISRLFMKNDIPSIVLKGTPDFCNVYIISKGKITSGRKASRPLRHISSSVGKLASHFKGETNPMPPFPRDKPIESRMSVSSEVYMPDPDISFASSGRLSTDSTCFAFDDFPTDSELSPRASKCSSLESKNPEPFLSESKSMDRNLSDELTATQIKSLTTQQIEEMEEKMRRLELELKQTMEMYHSACKVALKEKQKTKELQLLRMKDEKTIEEALREKEEALETAEREKALCKAAMDAARTAERMAHREAEKRAYAERKALKEAVAKKMILVSNLGRHHSKDNNITREKSLVHILVVVFIFCLYIVFALLT